jgi:hypothetical protein
MILHLKKDSELSDQEGHRFFWQAGQHSVEDGLAKKLLNLHADLFEEVVDDDGIALTPNPIHTQEPTSSEELVCDVCGKPVASQLGLISHRRTHNKGITTSDLIPHH